MRVAQDARHLPTLANLSQTLEETIAAAAMLSTSNFRRVPLVSTCASNYQNNSKEPSSSLKRRKKRQETRRRLLVWSKPTIVSLRIYRVRREHEAGDLWRSVGTSSLQPNRLPADKCRPAATVKSYCGAALPSARLSSIGRPGAAPVPSPYPTTQYSAPILLPASPTYLLLGSASTIRPQLVFKDGTSYTVSDYWRMDDQLHFTTLEEGGTKSVPRTVPFDTLDEPRTREAAAVQGFRFILRDEPLDQWLHPQHEKRRAGTGEKS